MIARKIAFLILPDYIPQGDIYADLQKSELEILIEAEAYVDSPHAYDIKRLKKTKKESDIWGISVVKALSVHKTYLRDDERVDAVARALSFYAQILSKKAIFSMVSLTVRAIQQLDEGIAKMLIEQVAERAIAQLTPIHLATLLGASNDPEEVYKARRFTTPLLEYLHGKEDYRSILAKNISKSLLARLVILHDLSGFETHLDTSGLGEKLSADLGL